VLNKAAAGNPVSLSGKGQKNAIEIRSRLGEQLFHFQNTRLQGWQVFKLHPNIIFSAFLYM
jgi:hypothetical protein